MKAYESCQVRKEAAISRYFCVEFIFHRMVEFLKMEASMIYTALYRKFRPLKFEDIVGQEHITKTLKNQVMAGRVGHAYLFNGTRGTGKTSAAKVLARAVNCLNPQNGEPCNECEICKAALAGSLTDIVEMDAASNNSVEDVRIIRDEVNFLPTLAKYRVYIIDEVHMLSTGAFNALLKTLEEPPAHVKFILATTEPQKLPATILSRCQRFDFKKISEENIEKRLKYICDESKIEITEEALKIIAVLSEGAMRDALSILERCIQEGNDKIDENLVKDLVGIPKLEFINGIAKSIVLYDIEEALRIIDEVIKQGKDINNLVWEIIKYIKDILVYKTSEKLEIYNKNEIEQIKMLADKISKERLLQIIYDLSELQNNMKWSTQKTLLFQVEIIKLCSNQESNNSGSTLNLEDLITRISNIENQLKNGIKIEKKEIETKQVEKKPESKKESNENKNTIKAKGSTPKEKWNNILSTLKQQGKILIYTNLIKCTPVEINDMVIGLEFKAGLTPFIKSIIEKPENTAEIEKIISVEYEKPMKIKLIDGAKEEVQVEKTSIDEFQNELDIPINIIEE